VQVRSIGPRDPTIVRTGGDGLDEIVVDGDAACLRKAGEIEGEDEAGFPGGAAGDPQSLAGGFEGEVGNLGERERMRLDWFLASRAEQFEGPGTPDGEDGTVGVDRESGDGRCRLSRCEDEGQGQEREVDRAWANHPSSSRMKVP
jgi:hypothetical protein